MHYRDDEAALEYVANVVDDAHDSPPYFARPDLQEQRGRLRIVDDEARAFRTLERRLLAPLRHSYVPQFAAANRFTVSTGASTPDVMASSVASTSSLASAFASSASFANFEVAVERKLTKALHDAAEIEDVDIDVVLARMGRHHRRDEKKRDVDAAAVMVVYRRGDNRYDAAARAKIEDREAERRDDIELVEGVMRGAIAERTHATAAFQIGHLIGDEHRARCAVQVAERETFADLMRKLAKLNLGLQIAFLKALLPDDGSGGDLLNNVQSTFFVAPTIFLDATARMLLRGVERAERDARINIEKRALLDAAEIADDAALVQPKATPPPPLSRRETSSAARVRLAQRRVVLREEEEVRRKLEEELIVAMGELVVFSPTTLQPHKPLAAKLSNKQSSMKVLFA